MKVGERGRVAGVEWRVVRATSPQTGCTGGSPLVPRGLTPATPAKKRELILSCSEDDVVACG
jgi:hypothetical protein